MLGFLFPNKGKFKLKENMEVELQLPDPEGPRSYFCNVIEASPKKAGFTTPKEGNRYVSINPNDIIKCIVLIDDRIHEVNVKVQTSLDREFEALVSKNVNSFETFLSKIKKSSDQPLLMEVPLDFRAITTSHLQRAVSRSISQDNMEMVTNLPVPEGTDLMLYFRVPDSPTIEVTGKSEKSVPLEEDSRKSKTRIVFSDPSKAQEAVETVTRYMAHYYRRLDRIKEMEERGEIPKSDDRLRPPMPPPR